MPSQAATVQEYLASLPEDRRAAIEAVRKVMLDNLDKAYAEGMQYGMIGYFVPHRVFPAGYHCDPKQPLPFAALASQKGHASLYLMYLYMNPVEDRRFREAWAKTGKKLDMGKSCIRFKRVEDLALDVLAQTIRRIPTKKYLEWYESTMAANKPAAKKTSKTASGETERRKKVTKKSAGRGR